MVPSQFVQLDEMPRTPNDKIDRTMLPAPEDILTGSAYPTALMDSIEDELAAIFEDVLKIRLPSRQESFFDLGGDSLLALQMRHKLRSTIGADLAVTDIFRSPTIRTLSDKLAGKEAPVVASLTAAQSRGSRRAEALRSRRRLH